MRYQLELEINQPRERVLEIFLNPKSPPEWQPSLVSYEPINWEDEYKVGAKTKQLHRMGKCRRVSRVGHKVDGTISSHFGRISSHQPHVPTPCHP